uniref:2-aminoethanethiol dioxygenase n=1 Tax=Acrobeloides nanus TaxID=290746 RepID=A0A914DSQ8_9BILA
MEGVTTEMLSVNLPPLPRASSPSRSFIYFASVYESPIKFQELEKNETDGLIECSIFGFTHANLALPLHNHPDIHGFIKVIRGKIQIKSFSWLDPDEEQKLMKLNMASGDHLLHHKKPVRFAGKTIISSEDKTIASLCPQIGNIHTIQSLEDGAAFFDLLIPGYIGRPCTYYADEVENPNFDEIYWLRTIPEPFCARTMRSMPYDSIHWLD